jgi:hypothetical protein
MRRATSYAWDLAAGLVSPLVMFVDEQHSRFWRRMLRLSLLGWAYLSWLTYALPATPQLDPVRRAGAIAALIGVAVTLVTLTMSVERGATDLRRLFRAGAMMGTAGTLGLVWAERGRMLDDDWLFVAEGEAAAAAVADHYVLTIGAFVAVVAALAGTADTRLFRHPAALWYGVQERRRVARRAAARPDPFANR